MIDSSFIIDYTNALYSADKSVCPTYDEFRDMFSSGQIQSKQWAVEELAKIKQSIESVVIAGAWYGTLGLMIHRLYPSSDVVLLDIDPRCKQFSDTAFYRYPKISAVTEDMYEYMYAEELVVNTSCEHIHDLKYWLTGVPDGTLVLLQSNNNENFDGHINCCESIEDFISKAGLDEILYSGQLEMPMYTRYMIIGLK